MSANSRSRCSPDSLVPSTLVSLASRNADQAGSTTAYRFVRCEGEVALSYSDVEWKARCVAAQLQHEGLDRTPVVLLLPTGSMFVAAFFGCAFAGVPAVPVAIPRTDTQVEVMMNVVRQSGARTIITTRALQARLLGRQSVPSAMETLQWKLVDDRIVGGDAWRPVSVSPDSPAVFQFTSGSTGRVRGVMVSHRNILANQAMIEQGFRHATDGVVVGWLPLFHDMGLIGNMLNPFYLLRPCILMPPQAFLREPRLWLETISEFKATTSGGPNFAFDLCASRVEGNVEDLDLSSWRVAFVGAEPVRAETLLRFAHKFAAAKFEPAAFYPCYGLAEATLIVTGTDRGESSSSEESTARTSALIATANTDGGSVPCGGPLGSQTVIVVDPERQLPCADGVAGEVWISGPCVASGYVGDPAATETTFSAFLDDGRGPFLRTGDIGVLTGGQLTLRGRIKNMIIVNGTNYFAEDIEGWLEKCHPDLEPGCLAAFASSIGDSECLAVAAEIRRDIARGMDAVALVDRIRERAAELIDAPVSEVIVCRTGAIPRTTSGKIRHWKCAEALDAQCDRILYRSVIHPRIDAPYGVGVSRLERHAPDLATWLRRRIAHIVRQPESAIADSSSFAQLGISSSDALRLTAELGEALGMTLDDTLFWEYPSIEAVAGFLSETKE